MLFQRQDDVVVVDDDNDDDDTEHAVRRMMMRIQKCLGTNKNKPCIVRYRRVTESN